MAQYDCIIIGGGHNGLITAAYLARARRKVCLLERRHVMRCTIPSTVDDSLCPPGKHVMGIFVQYAP